MVKKNAILVFLSNRTVRLLLLFYLVVIATATLLIVFSYFQERNLLEEQRLQRLDGIVSSVAAQTDPQEHLIVVSKLMESPDPEIAVNPIYLKLRKELNKVQKANHLKTPIYTIFYHADRNTFCYGVRSDEKIFLYDEYKQFPRELLYKMKEGGVLRPYTTENGTWISAFHPIKDTTGNVVALLEADEEFSSFIDISKRGLFKNVLLELLGVFILSLFIFPFLLKLFRSEQLMITKLALKTEHLNQLHEENTSSLRYASSLQNALLPSLHEMNECFRDFFVFYKPKDHVSGDFYWLHKKDHITYLAVADCTGHGIPGAILSVLCKNVLDKVIENYSSVDTDIFLEKVDAELKQTISRNNNNSRFRDGMEIGIIRFDSFSKSLQFSGAGIDLIISDKKELESIKSSNIYIGTAENFNSVHFDIYQSKVNKGSFFYMFSDGLKDQFGGSKNKKFTIKRLMQHISEMQGLSCVEQNARINEALNSWKGEIEQTDDMLMIGVQLY